MHVRLQNGDLHSSEGRELMASDTKGDSCAYMHLSHKFIALKENKWLEALYSTALGVNIK